MTEATAQPAADLGNCRQPNCARVLHVTSRPPLEVASWVAGIAAAVIAAVALLGPFQTREELAPAPARTTALAMTGTTTGPVAPDASPSQHTDAEMAPRWGTVYLAETQWVAGAAYWDDGPATINGVSYPRSLTFPIETPAKWLEYDLQRRCTAFQATVGISDKVADIGNPVMAEIWLDGEVVYQEILEFGRPEQVDLDVSGKLRLRISAVQVKDVASYSVVFGDARLQCE